MVLLSKKLKTVHPSATLAISQKASELILAGREIFKLSAGEPDFSTPEHVCASAYQAIENGETCYTPVSGTQKLKKAIVAHLANTYHINYKDQNVIVSNGAKQVIFNALQATLDPEDEVIIPAPYWTSYPEMVRLNSGLPVIITCTHELKLTPNQLSQAITQRTKWLILNTPNNPSGSVYSAEELKALEKVLLNNPHVHILSDEIYAQIVYGPQKFYSFAQCCPQLKERTLIVNGVSKSYAMTGWRIGYGAGPTALIQAMGLIQSQTTSNACSVSQAAAIAALTGPQDFLEERLKIFKKRRDLVCDTINKIPYLKIATKPSGAFYVLIDCRAYLKHAGVQGDVALCALLLEKANTALVPGTAFGCAGFVRLSYAVTEKDIIQAMDNIRQVLS